MNAERLRTYVGWLLADEKEFKIQELLSALNGSLTNLASAPQETSHQKAVSEALRKLSDQMNALVETYDAAQFRGVGTIGSMPFFSQEMISGIRAAIAENAMTPAVAQAYVSKLVSDRDKYLKVLQSTSSSLKALSISSDTLEDDEAEIGFQIPREIFHNNLDGLINELRAIKRILRAFSELTTKSIEEIRVR